MRGYLILGAIILALAGLNAWLLFKGNPWKERAVVAEKTVDLREQEGRIVERTFTNERTIYRDAEKSADAVEAAQGAETPVPPDVLGAWSAGVAGLRQRAGADPTADTAVAPR